jgi:hypothetical protein
MKTEHEEQRELVQWIRQACGVRVFAIPNGGLRGIAAAGRLKAEGVSAGVPDLFVPAWLLWIEMKRETGGSVSSEQQSWHDYLRNLGHYVIVGRGQEDAKEKMRNLGFVPRN